MTQRRRKFYQTIQKQILVWAGQESLRLAYDGDTIHVPARDEIARKDAAGTRYRFNSAVSAEGNYVEGTLEVMDGYRRTPEGGEEKIFDVAALCAYIEKDRQDLIVQGLEIVTDVADCRAAMDECIPRWDATRDDRARRIIVDELERRKRIEERGGTVFAGSSEADVIWAHEHQLRRGPSAQPAVTTEDLKRAMLGQPPADSEQAETNLREDELPPSAEIYLPKPPKIGVSTEELTGRAQEAPAGGINVMQMRRTAKALGVRLGKKELEGLLDGEQDTIELVAEKITVARQEAHDDARRREQEKQTEAAAPG
jgi:hypothetical protein